MHTSDRVARWPSSPTGDDDRKRVGYALAWTRILRRPRVRQQVSTAPNCRPASRALAVRRAASLLRDVTSLRPPCLAEHADCTLLRPLLAVPIKLALVLGGLADLLRIERTCRRGDRLPLAVGASAVSSAARPWGQAAASSASPCRRSRRSRRNRRSRARARRPSLTCLTALTPYPPAGRRARGFWSPGGSVPT
jgi:hypothetical protein